MLVTLKTPGHGIYVTLIYYMHNATAHSKEEEKNLIAWAAELSWGLEVPFETTVGCGPQSKSASWGVELYLKKTKQKKKH